MMITTRFREVVWTGGVCAAALSFYMVSQTVAAERAKLAGVERDISRTGQQIRLLETEIATRGGASQIESWNQQVYGLKAPGPEQFVTSAVRLVALTMPHGAPALPLDPTIVASHGAVNQVSLNRIEDNMATSPRSAPVPAAPAPVGTQPILRQATYVQAKPSALAPSTPTSVHETSAKTTLDKDFLAGIGDDGAQARSSKVRP